MAQRWKIWTFSHSRIVSAVRQKSNQYNVSCITVTERATMNYTEGRPIASATFRLPPSVLNTVDAWCDKNDISRSQFFRHAIVDRVKALVLTNEPTQPWSQPLYKRAGQ